MRLHIIALLLIAVHLNIAFTREITHEDIKDAILSLVHMMRENNEKLERHEARERQLGEQVKKSLAILTKRMTTVDALKAQLSKLDDRIAGIEHLILQRDERERIQMQKTADTLEDLESRLEGWLTDIENKITEVNSHGDVTIPPLDTRPDIVSKLNTTESLLTGQISRLEETLKADSEKQKEEANNQKLKMQTLFSEVQDINARMSDVEILLEKVKENTQGIQNKPEEKQTDVVPIIVEQARTLIRVQELLEDASDRIRELPRTTEVQALQNETQALLQETKHAVKDNIVKEINNLESKLVENKEEAKESMNALRMDLANNAERVNQELHDLGKGQSVMVSMADHILDTKKRVEYGVHQILLEVGDLVKAQSTNINNTLNQRFNGISNDIMDNQNGALANLTFKMEQEMNQVWRQINVMYQQMMESAKALDKLHKQNEEYVNGTTSTMGGMESKVSEITKRMTEVDENLNYLLGRLSLVTQEFNQIKSGLGTALDNIKASFKEVQEKANDLSHPGPHPVPSNYEGLVTSETEKPDVVTVK